MKKLLFALLLPMAAMAQGGKEFKIKGTLKTAKPVDWIYLRYTSGDKQNTDSLQPKTVNTNLKDRLMSRHLPTCR